MPRKARIDAPDVLSRVLRDYRQGDQTQENFSKFWFFNKLPFQEV
jgi:hypothetical protein